MYVINMGTETKRCNRNQFKSKSSGMKCNIAIYGKIVVAMDIITQDGDEKLLL